MIVHTVDDRRHSDATTIVVRPRNDFETRSEDRSCDAPKQLADVCRRARELFDFAAKPGG